MVAEFLVPLFDRLELFSPFFRLDGQGLLQLFRSDIESVNVKGAFGGSLAQRGVNSFGGAGNTFEHPLENTRVLRETGPQERIVVVTAEPVDVEDLRQLGAFGLADVQPVLEVVTDVVADERTHGHGVAADNADLAFSGGGLFGGQDRAHEHTVLPVVRFGHQRHRGLATTAEQDCRNRDAVGVLPFRSRGGHVGNRGAEARVRVGCRGRGLRSPVVALPVGQVGRGFVGLAFPPHGVVIGEGNVGEDVAASVDCYHCGRVGRVAGAGSNAEQAVFGVDRVELTVVAEAHPGDVIAEGLSLPTGDGRRDHCEVRLTAGRRECGRDVLGFAFGVGQLDDEHVLGQPAFVAGNGRSNAQRVALLAQQSVAAVAGSVGPDGAVFWEVGDVLGLAARPSDVFFARFERGTHRVHAFDELAVVLVDSLKDFV